MNINGQIHCGYLCWVVGKFVCVWPHLCIGIQNKTHTLLFHVTLACLQEQSN